MAQAKLKAGSEYQAADGNDSEAPSLDSAAARLANSLERMERAIERMGQGGSANDGQSDLFRQENAQLKADKDQLSQALAQMKQRYAQLKLASMKVADRLDQAIERMDSLNA